MMICSMIMCFIINPTMSMIFLGALILLGFVLFFIIFKVTPIFTEGFAKYDDLNASVQENVSGIRVVKAYVREDFEKEKERLHKEKDKLTKELARSKGMLSNEKFLNNAKPEKVQEEKDKLAKYEQMMAQVEARLAQMK